MVRAILLLTDGTYKIVEPASCKEYQTLLGGFFEALPTNKERMSCYVNEEGRLKNLAPNPWEFYLSIRLEFCVEGLVGNALLLGHGEYGDDIDVDQDIELSVCSYYTDHFL